ncbi:MAG TPA: hypothetical protein VNT50_00995 [Microbacterium sp.]|uniref:hypothetical protein n=1 Tax=Microbacterium sp. TaxID=51671 RepID=UPI002C3762B2|nr:hypothetical protein [Microbacterium sp.]HWI30043.1 hypothetical protein [Microbacterium sp.]
MSQLQAQEVGADRVRGAVPALSIVTTWVFALLPANLVPMIVGELVGRFSVPLDLAGIAATSMTLVNAAVVLSVRPLLAKGRRGSLSAVGLAILVSVYLVAALIPIAPVVLGALVLGGVGSGLMVAAATASLSSMQNPDPITAVAMIVNRVVVAGVFILIPVLGGSFEAMMWALISIGLITFALSRRLPPAVATSPDVAPAGRPAAQSRQALAWLLSVGFALWTVTDEATYALIEIFLGVNIPTLSKDDLPMIYAGAILFGLLGALAAPLFLRFVGRVPSLAVLFGVSIVAKFLLAGGTDQIEVLVASLAWGFALGAIIPLIFGLAAATSSDGRVSVLVNGFYTLGAGLGPLIGTQLLVRSSPVWVGAILAVIGAIAAITVVLVAARLVKRQKLGNGEPLEPHAGAVDAERDESYAIAVR